MDTTYIPMARGFVYLAADWASHRVLAWRVSISLTTDFCLEALEAALAQGRPEIFNTDQGVQYTANAFTSRLQQAQVLISMDGRGRALDNVFIERLWRSVKQECLYLHGFDTVPELTQGLGDYFDFYRYERQHQALDYCTPAEVYRRRAKRR